FYAQSVCVSEIIRLNILAFVVVQELIVRRYQFLVFHDAYTPKIYTLSLHDALPIFEGCAPCVAFVNTYRGTINAARKLREVDIPDRKSTRLNSSHVSISYAVFCLKKKNRTATPSRLAL